MEASLDDPEAAAAQAALEGNDEGSKGRCRALLSRAASTWNFRHIARGFASWLEVVRMESKQSVPARVGHILTVPPKNRTFEEIDALKTWLCSEYGHVFSELASDALSLVARSLRFRKVLRKEILTMQGQTGTCFFVVTSGTLAVCYNDQRTAEKRLADYLQLERDVDGKILRLPDTLDGYCGPILRQVRSGATLGEMSLLTSNSVRSASIVGKAAVSEVLEIEKWVYRQYIASHHGFFQLTKRKLALLRSLAIFSSCDNTRLVHLAYAFEVGPRDSDGGGVSSGSSSFCASTRYARKARSWGVLATNCAYPCVMRSTCVFRSGSKMLSAPRVLYRVIN